LLTDGSLDEDKTTFRTPSGQAKYYFATDRLGDTDYQGILLSDFLSAAQTAGLGWDPGSQTGAVYHMLRALEEQGGIGVTATGARDLPRRGHASRPARRKEDKPQLGSVLRPASDAPRTTNAAPPLPSQSGRVADQGSRRPQGTSTGRPGRRCPRFRNRRRKRARRDPHSKRSELVQNGRQERLLRDARNPTEGGVRAAFSRLRDLVRPLRAAAVASVRPPRRGQCRHGRTRRGVG
jgi:hypothetical protein